MLTQKRTGGVICIKKKQIIWRRSISVFLALLLCLTLLPAAALAANTPPCITAIGGNENQNISTNNRGNGWSYDADSATLTLTNIAKNLADCLSQGNNLSFLNDRGDLSGGLLDFLPLSNAINRYALLSHELLYHFPE